KASRTRSFAIAAWWSSVTVSACRGRRSSSPRRRRRSAPPPPPSAPTPTPCWPGSASTRARSRRFIGTVSSNSEGETMAGRLDGKVAVITGGGSGIGRDTVLRFPEEGARVVLGDLNETTARETLDLAARAHHGSPVRFQRTDVAEEADVEALIALATREFGR